MAPIDNRRQRRRFTTRASASSIRYEVCGSASARAITPRHDEGEARHADHLKIERWKLCTIGCQALTIALASAHRVNIDSPR